MPVNPSEQRLFYEMTRLALSFTGQKPTLQSIRDFVKLMRPYVDEPAPISFEDQSIYLSDARQLRLRSYRFDNRPRPLIIYFPGNAFIHDMFEENHSIISKIAYQAHSHAIMVDYRLAPENPFPCAVEDALECVHYLTNHVYLYNFNPSQVIIAGFSSGANLAAVVTNYFRKSPHLTVYHQLLISGAYDYTDSLHEFDHFALQDKLLDPQSAQFSFDCYSKANQRKDPKCSPYWEADLSGLPPTTLMMGEYDGGRSQGEAYAKRLSDAGNQVDKIIGRGQTHGTILYRKLSNDGDDPSVVAGQKLYALLKTGQAFPE